MPSTFGKILGSKRSQEVEDGPGDVRIAVLELKRTVPASGLFDASAYPYDVLDDTSVWDTFGLVRGYRPPRDRGDGGGLPRH